MPSKIFFKENLRVQSYGWPLYFGLMLMFNRHLRPEVDLWSQSVALLILFVVFNACLGLFYTLLLKKWIWRSVLLAFILFFMTTELLQYIGALFTNTKDQQGVWINWIRVDDLYYWKMANKYLGVMTMAAVLALHIKSQINVHYREEEIKRRHEKEIEARDNMIAFRTLQINPHFLSNVLAGIRKQTAEVAPQVTRSMEKLIELMQYMLTTSSEGKTSVVINREMAALDRYIELERGRLNPCYVDYKVVGRPSGQKVPPVALITLVENAFKYGVYTDPRNPVKVHLTLREDQIAFECSNTISKTNRYAPSTGLGLKNILSRLDMVFPGSYFFQAKETEGHKYQVKLVIGQRLTSDEKIEMSSCG